MAKRIMVALGTRPECIKLAPVVAALRARPGDFETIVCSSGQQREMLDQTLAALELSVDRDLDVMRPDQSLADLTAALVSGFSAAISELRPDWILVQGDTTTAFAAALSAYYQRVPIGHVEAGLRSNDRFNPFPEEINRRLISSLADLHFAPTAAAANALRSEGVPGDAIHVTGNTVVDALLALQSRFATPDGAKQISKAIRDLADSSAFILVTCHRRESFGEHLGAILRAIRRIALAHRSYRVIFPVHFNPHVRAFGRSHPWRCAEHPSAGPCQLPRQHPSPVAGKPGAHGFRRPAGGITLPGQTSAGAAQCNRSPRSYSGWGGEIGRRQRERHSLWLHRIDGRFGPVSANGTKPRPVRRWHGWAKDRQHLEVL